MNTYWCLLNHVYNHEMSVASFGRVTQSCGMQRAKRRNDSTIGVAETVPSPPQEELPEPGTLQPSAEVSEEAVEVESPEPASGVVVADRKFIKTGRIAFDTDNPIATRKQIMASVRANHAYVSRDDEERSGDQITYTIVVHVLRPVSTRF
ncbi:MAG: hypothetical protein ACO1N1_21040 [Dyadobacter fermentans]